MTDNRSLTGAALFVQGARHSKAYARALYRKFPSYAAIIRATLRCVTPFAPKGWLARRYGIRATEASAKASEGLRILVISEARSIHAARFVALLREMGHETRLFHSDMAYFEEENLDETVLYISSFNGSYTSRNRLVVSDPISYEVRPADARQKWLRRMTDILSGTRSRAVDLVEVVRSYHPDLVISARMQNDGYVAREAKALLGAFPCPWIHFTWGTDIEFFGKDPEYAQRHLPLIRGVLEGCDYLLSDCARDAIQAPEFGFRGSHLGVFPAHGGFNRPWLREIPRLAVQQRDVILIKGREGSYVGRAMTILHALMSIRDSITQYRLVFILTTPNMKQALEVLGTVADFRYEIAENLPYEELLALYGKARLAISATTVDGTPSFLLEAMAMGALPVHSDMPSVREWVVDGENGLLFPIEDVGILKQMILRGLGDDQLIKAAAEQNKAIVEERLDRDVIRATLKAQIDTVVPFEARGEASWEQSRSVPRP
jgi:glycosyltransferase involved in cell wall biosynthesis